MSVKQNPRCKCGKYLADFGRIHADSSTACDVWHQIADMHSIQQIAPGPYNVYSDGDGHYAVMAADRKIIHYALASDFARMKALELNKSIHA